MEISIETKLGLIGAVEKAINSQFGENTMVNPSSAPEGLLDKKIISSGCLAVDNATLIGGFPRGSVVEIFGPEQCCKSLLAVSTIAEAQKQGGIGVIIDIERAIDVEWIQKQGIDLSRLRIVYPKSAEQACDIILALVRQAHVDVVVVDSVAALPPTKQLETSMQDNDPLALQARLMSDFLKIVLPDLYDAANYSKTLLILVNQIRDKITLYGGGGYSTPGGKAIKFYSKMRIQLTKGDPIKRKGMHIGDIIKGRIVKCKVSPAANALFTFRMIYGKGIDKVDEMITHAVYHGIISEGGGGNYKFKHESLPEQNIRGRQSLIEMIEEDDELFENLKALVSEASK